MLLSFKVTAVDTYATLASATGTPWPQTKASSSSGAEETCCHQAVPQAWQEDEADRPILEVEDSSPRLSSQCRSRKQRSFQKSEPSIF